MTVQFRFPLAGFGARKRFGREGFAAETSWSGRPAEFYRMNYHFSLRSGQIEIILYRGNGVLPLTAGSSSEPVLMTPIKR
jgi:hypothetical protein